MVGSSMRLNEPSRKARIARLWLIGLPILVAGNAVVAVFGAIPESWFDTTLFLRSLVLGLILFIIGTLWLLSNPPNKPSPTDDAQPSNFT